jgi:hypothetical protein
VIEILTSASLSSAQLCFKKVGSLKLASQQLQTLQRVAKFWLLFLIHILSTSSFRIELRGTCVPCFHALPQGYPIGSNFSDNA